MLNSLHKHTSRLFILSLALVAALAGAAQACPSCKQALATADTAQGDIVGAYFWSILFMLSMPIALISTFSFSMWRAVKKANAAKANTESAELAARNAEQPGAGGAGG